MRRLSDTLIRLNAMMPAGGAAADAGPGRLAALAAFGDDPGALRGWVHIPADLAPGAPLVVVLHGCTQTAAAYDRGAGWSDLADRQGFAVLFPEQQRANNPNLCFNWFAPEDTRRGGGEAASIRAMIEATVRAHRIDRARIFVTGLSAGGAMASTMLATYPETFAGGAIIAGLPHGTATSVSQALDRTRGHGDATGPALAALVEDASPHRGPWPRISIWHGTADRTVDATNAAAIVAQWRPLHGAGDAIAATPLDGYPRTEWRDAAGRVVIEHVAVTGLGHGTPLATAGDDACGQAGPHMLEAGISSTRHIARFWGLVGAAAASARAGDGEREDMAPARPDRPGGAAGIIEDALRAAGLMR